MGNRTRICNAQCHNAKGSKCRCWCGGKFHGAAGHQWRHVFTNAFKKLPRTQAEFDLLKQTPKLF